VNRSIECLASLLLAALLAGCQSAPKQQAEPVAMVADPYLREVPAVPASAQAAFDAALAALRAQQWQSAERQFKALHEAQPRLSGPLLNLALLSARAGRDADAENYFQRAIAVNGNNLAALNQYAIWLREHGRFDQAETFYRQALARWPDHPESHLNLGILYDLYRGKPEQALSHYQRYLELNGDGDTPVRGWVMELQRRLDAGKS
jgi:Tfp pilus assembly protein PilF